MGNDPNSASALNFKKLFNDALQKGVHRGMSKVEIAEKSGFIASQKVYYYAQHPWALPWDRLEAFAKAVRLNKEQTEEIQVAWFKSRTGTGTLAAAWEANFKLLKKLMPDEDQHRKELLKLAKAYAGSIVPRAHVQAARERRKAK